ncbi:MAG TPA: FtsQ-type POTRA domain-containing protein [Pyrinomonadaceae bacterium]|nr:FtsQ-type POTRA domain-containing protein [Pyrinomonadaceae bacterium]
MTTQKRGTTRRNTNTTAKKSRRTAANRKKGSGTFANVFVPLFFIVGILFCLGFLSFMGYRTATASAFFDVKKIEVRGTNRASKDDIERIARSYSEKSGVWNADLEAIKSDVEKSVLVKTAVVSRILPDGLRVNVTERVPRAVVRTNAGDFWADDDAVILGEVGKDEVRPPFVLRGWDEAKNEKAMKDNRERVKIYVKMLNEWQDYELAKRVNAVNLADLREPYAIVQDSGESVKIILANENYKSRLKSGLEKIAGRGKEVESIDVSSSSERLAFREKL